MKTVFVAGHRGMVGAAIVKQLEARDGIKIITQTRSELDLTNQAAVSAFFAESQIDEVYLAAAKVGGIHANNTYPAEFIYENLMIEANIIHAAHANDVQKLLFLGSSCIYPKLAEQPMTEKALLTGTLEETNEPYAIAKIAGIKLCESYNRQYGRDYRSVMPTNLYGPNDNFHPENSHVIPALIHKMHKAKQKDENVVLWGDGTPLREFTYSKDLANILLFLLEHYDGKEPINVGNTGEHSICWIAQLIARNLDFNNSIIWDTDKPAGQHRKPSSNEKLLQLGWREDMYTELEAGIEHACNWFLENYPNVRGAE